MVFFVSFPIIFFFGGGFVVCIHAGYKISPGFPFGFLECFAGYDSTFCIDLGFC